ncbi:M18 family aminopeptidase [Sulfurimonas marina]|uniref:M18 family aminopeptidase n=1 Tax=Sulfurimonas marina TaxID=2590551 RepID=A0A7M1AUM3_9BACT|nr:M18 family aminopeptidase [Sulfurimonas marina]QOP41119.1 M18 family aminopeptidase [Sulfurimonas marina]
MTKQDFNEGLLGFLDASPTPFHATQNMAGMFSNAGFIELNEKEKWNLEAGEKYFVTRNDSSIIAFTYPKNSKEYLMVGSHTDSPNLKLKPNPVVKEHGIVKFAVEPYGGLLLNPWFDRNLGLAGRVNYSDSSKAVKSALINIDKSIAMIPSLAIHLDDKANQDRTINRQTDISPVISCNEDFDFEIFIKNELAKMGIKDVEELYAHELSLYDTQNASYIGVEDEFIASARLDNLLSCYVGMLSICSIPNDKPMLFVANDHEEVGSDSTSGAGGSFLESTLKRMFTDFDDYVAMARSSMMISADNAHAIHPNYPSKHEPNHAPYINDGIVIKINANQRYASNSTTISTFLANAKRLEAQTQTFVTRSDLGCGSTIGPITATKIGIETIDIGLPTWGMHSIREMAGSDDAYELYNILVGFNI